MNKPHQLNRDLNKEFVMKRDTKSLIGDKYVELLMENDGEPISVQELIYECDINKQTFYSHFKTIMDVAEWTMFERLKIALIDVNRTKTSDEAVVLMVKHVRLNSQLMRKMVQSKNYYFFQKIFLKIVKSFLEKLVEKEGSFLRIGHEDLEMAIDFYACGLTTYIIQQGLEDNVDEARLAQQINNLFKGDYILFDDPEKVEEESFEMQESIGTLDKKEIDDLFETKDVDDTNDAVYF